MFSSTCCCSSQTGPPGETGNKGPEGSRGQPGKEGKDGQLGPRGMQGDMGVPGLPGAQGPAVRSQLSPESELKQRFSFRNAECLGVVGIKLYRQKTHHCLRSVFVQGKSPSDTHIKQVCMRVIQGKWLIRVCSVRSTSYLLYQKQKNEYKCVNIVDTWYLLHSV